MTFIHLYAHGFVHVYRSCAYANEECIFLSTLTIQMSVAYDKYIQFDKKNIMLNLLYFLSLLNDETNCLEILFLKLQKNYLI